MKNLQIFFSILSCVLLFSCTKPEEDRIDITGTVDKSKLSYSFSQESGYDNKLMLSYNSTIGNVFWDVLSYSSGLRITSGNSIMDTLYLPFKGDYLLKTYGYYHNGFVIDSVMITTSQPDPIFFANPIWKLLTNENAGKYWVIKAKYVGPESDYLSNWWQPDISTEVWANDSVYFDIDFRFKYDHYRAGTVNSSSFTLKTDNFATAPTIISFGSDQATMANDDNGEMSSANQNKYRIFKCTNDTLIVGQGASLTQSRQSEDWAWYWVYVRSDL